MEIACIAFLYLVHTTYNNIYSCDVVANRGEDLRFPISSSSGFSSPFAFLTLNLFREWKDPAWVSMQGFFYMTGISESGPTIVKVSNSVMHISALSLHPPTSSIRAFLPDLCLSALSPTSRKPFPRQYAF